MSDYSPTWNEIDEVIAKYTTVDMAKRLLELEHQSRLAGPSHSYADVIAKQLGDRAGSWMNVQLSRGEWDEVVALLRLAGPGVPVEGWKLVPEQVTEKMLDAWFNTHGGEFDGTIKEFQPRWLAMINASPATTGGN